MPNSIEIVDSNGKTFRYVNLPDSLIDLIIDSAKFEMRRVTVN